MKKKYILREKYRGKHIQRATYMEKEIQRYTRQEIYRRKDIKKDKWKQIHREGYMEE